VLPLFWLDFLLIDPEILGNIGTSLKDFCLDLRSNLHDRSSCFERSFGVSFQVRSKTEVGIFDGSNAHDVCRTGSLPDRPHRGSAWEGGASDESGNDGKRQGCEACEMLHEYS
jgi:hypothetical protein